MKGIYTGADELPPKFESSSSYVGYTTDKPQVDERKTWTVQDLKAYLEPLDPEMDIYFEGCEFNEDRIRIGEHKGKPRLDIGV